ncbi:MAG: YerC/YecD family TrpR-related protein [Christensenellales bacterium]
MYKSKLKSDDLDKLFTAILSLNSKEECYMFFEDICTISELKSISQRLRVAQLLSQGRTCHEISSLTGASTATISRVNRYLNYGTGGYKSVLERL